MRTWDPDGTRVKSGVALDLENGQTGENHRRTRAGSEPVETHRHFTIVAWCHHHCGTKSEDQSAWFFLLFFSGWSSEAHVVFHGGTDPSGLLGDNNTC